VPFGGGSDHYIFNDGALKVPSVMFGHGDTFHHTSLDTPDKVDPSELRRVCFITLGSLCYMANAMETEARETARLIVRNGIGRLSENYYDTQATVFAADSSPKLFDAYKQTLNVIEHGTRREKEAVLATLKFAQSPVLKAEVSGLTKNLDLLGTGFKAEAMKIYTALCEKFKAKPEVVSQGPEEKKFSGVVPVRDTNFICPLEMDYLVEKLGADVVGQIKLRGYTAYEALNFVDGKRSILEIVNAVSAEYGSQKAQDVLDFFSVLEKAGLLKLTAKT
jgi:hypothetical protein